MAWKNYESWETGKVCVSLDGDVIPFLWERGEITTGRQRVFHRFYIRLYLRDNTTLVGIDERSLRAALVHLNDMAHERGVELLAAGLDERWAESGLSHNSGWGYFERVRRAMHMMELPPLDEREPENNDLTNKAIREAVAGLCKQPPFVRRTPESPGSSTSGCNR